MRAFEAYDAGEDTYQTEAVRRYKMIQRWQKSVVDVFGVQPIIFGVDQNVHPTPTSCDVLNKWNLSCTDEPRYPHFTNGNQARNGEYIFTVFPYCMGNCTDVVFFLCKVVGWWL